MTTALEDCSCIWSMHEGGGSVYIADKDCPALPHERTYTNDEEEDSMNEQYKTKAQSVYVAGPMAGYEDFNFPLFAATTELLRGEGFRVVSPAELDEDGFFEGTDKETFSVRPDARAKYMERDLPHVIDCDAIALLPGWQESTGANIELMTALVCGKEVWEFFEDGRGGLALAYSDARPDLWRIVGHVIALEDVVRAVFDGE